LIDPRTLDLPVHGHSGYWGDPGYRRALEDFGET
jgi:hypothetical protein